MEKSCRPIGKEIADIVMARFQVLTTFCYYKKNIIILLNFGGSHFFENVVPEVSFFVTLNGARNWRLLYFAGTVKLWESPGKAGGLPKGNYGSCRQCRRETARQDDAVGSKTSDIKACSVTRCRLKGEVDETG